MCCNWTLALGRLLQADGPPGPQPPPLNIRWCALQHPHHPPCPFEVVGQPPWSLSSRAVGVRAATGALPLACPRSLHPAEQSRTGTCCVDAVVWRLTQAGTTQGEPQQNRTVDWQKSSPPRRQHSKSTARSPFVPATRSTNTLHHTARGQDSGTHHTGAQTSQLLGLG